MRRWSNVFPWFGVGMCGVACNAIVGNEEGRVRPALADGGGPDADGGGPGDGGVPRDASRDAAAELQIDAGPPVATVQTSPRLFTTGNWLYYTDFEDGSGTTTFRRLAQSGGPIQKILTHARIIADLASDDNELFFATATCPGEVLACAINATTGACGVPRIVAQTQAGPRRLSLDSATVAWANAAASCGATAASAPATAMRAQRPNGAPTPVRPGYASPLMPVAVARIGKATAIAVRKADGTQGYVEHCAEGGTCTFLGAGVASELVVSGETLFWIAEGPAPDFSGGAILRAGLATSARRWVENQRHPEGLAVDATDVYWTTNIATDPLAPGTVARCSQTDACILSVPQILTRPLGPRAIVVDPKFVTFAAAYPPGFGIFRFAK